MGREWQDSRRSADAPAAPPTPEPPRLPLYAAVSGRRAGAGMSFRVEGVPDVLPSVAEADRLQREGGAPGGLGSTNERSPTDRLGWVDRPRIAAAELARYRTLRRELVSEGISRVVVIAMGGSALVAETLVEGLPDRGAGLEVRVLQSLAPEAARELLDAPEFRSTAFVVASKSGVTAETLALEGVVAERLRAERCPVRRRLLAISDRGSPLFERAGRDYRARFAGSPRVGGRFSGLEPFGLLPAVLAGLDPGPGLEDARRVRDRLDGPPPPPPHPMDEGVFDVPDFGFRLGVLLARLAEAGRPVAHWSAAPRYRAMLEWLEQMCSESTGKQGKGIVPIVLPPAPRPSVPPANGFRIHLGEEEDGGAERLDMVRAEVPWIAVPLTPIELPAAVFRWQVAIAVAAWRMGVDPYDQPDVEAARKAARRLVNDPAGAPGPAPVGDAAIGAFLARAAQGGLAINAFGHRSAAAEAGIRTLRRRIAERFGAFPAAGFGSQLLHSLGQLEKGGSRDLAVLMLRWESDGPDLEVPGAPGRLGTGRLAALQAAADHEELRRLGRRVLWLDAPAPGDRGLRALLDRLDRVLAA